MTKKVFTDESLSTFVDEIKAYTDEVVSSSEKVYSQNDEPANAEEGSLWIDLDETEIEGIQGKSAYEYAQDSGFTGTEEQFSKKMNIPFVMPEMFGAVGNEGIDDSAAIQAAINAGDNILLMGNYAINSPITIGSEKTIRIDGRVKVNCSTGFIIQGTNIHIYGDGTIWLPDSNNNCTGIRFQVGNGGTSFVKLEDFTVWGSYRSAFEQQSTGIEFIGDETEGQCCYININCNLRGLYRGVYTHKATGQHESSWVTQVDVNATIENCVQAVCFGWHGTGSRIHGVIQPKCSSTIPAGSKDEPLVVLPPHGYIDAMIWDIDTAVNKYAIEISQKHCTVWTNMADEYLLISDTAKPTLALRRPNDYWENKFMPVSGGRFSGNIGFDGTEIGLMLKNSDGDEERVRVTSQGFLCIGAGYTNQLNFATDEDRTTVVRYQLGVLHSSGVFNLSQYSDRYCTGYISATPGSVLRVKNVTVPNSGGNQMYIIAYDSSNNKTGYLQYNILSASEFGWTNGIGGDFEITLDSKTFGENFTAIRFSAYVIDNNTIVTINEPIEQKDMLIPTKTSQLINDSGFQTELNNSEVWTFTLEDGSTVNKTVVVK